MGLPIIAAVLVAVSLTSCSRPETPESPATPPAAEVTAIPDDWKTYTDREAGFSVSYPPEWKVSQVMPGKDENGTMIETARLASNQTMEDGTPESLCHIGSDRVGTPSEAFWKEGVDQFNEDSFNMLRKIFPDIRKLQSGVRQVGGRRAVYRESTFSDVSEGGKTRYQWISWAVQVYHRNNQYTLGCRAVAARYPSLADTFGLVRDSLRLHP